MSEDKETERQSFIAEARRKQIITAAIDTLDEIGFVSASLAQIAKRAGISTALISYHFRDKQDLMDQTLMALVERATAYVAERINPQKSARERLHTYIESNLAYQGTHPKHNIALIEIVFNARTADNIPYYRLSDDEVEPLTQILQEILRDGQASGEFRQFNIPIMALTIRGAIGEYLVNPNLSAAVDLELHSAELVDIFDRVVIL